MVTDVVEHARFFDHLVELVPAKYYYDDDFAKVNPRHLAKAAREAYRAELKQKKKELKRDKLDPNKMATTLAIQRQKSQAAQPGAAGGGHAPDVGPSTSGRGKQPAEAGKPPKGPKGKGGAAADAGTDAGANAGTAAGLQLQLSGAALSRDELLERLHKKMEEARQRRKASGETAAQAKEWRTNALKSNVAEKQQQQQQQQKGGKRKAEDSRPEGGAAGKQAGGKEGAKGQQGQAAKKARQEEQPAGADADFKFARIEVDEGGRKGHGAKRPPKQVLLKQAEAHKAELEALAGTEEGKVKAQAAAWKAALSRAGGEKVLDDPKLLRRSLKRESKRKEKHSKAWQERVATQQEAQAARQAKRTDNLAARRQAKVDARKAKREKKLLRPGFEGRKEGFITPGGGAAAK
ncbi:hypothetical protein GPECTOR_88g466 [Gonium pectorale]|uniref:Ribosomal RNA-processing protein 14/surfeit locus protein 6 C-terminal domain-containing protein n=1 Tax=Gonium pectorale TaxID=33097 RepID=A0A150G0W3_GONPE|nr:hypothetical protein GPECTOR_88g466 [Gonium pectorale]|eukprot:KXZ43523.1 hypothetical protein GPECTOR_88g466 [Gonium pectorale]